MLKKLSLFSGIALLVLLVGVVGVSSVFAQEPTPEPGVPPAGDMPARPGGLGRSGGRMDRRGWGLGRDWTVFDAAAEALGLTPEELFSELHGGKTLEEVAEEQGVEIETVREAMREARQEAMRQAAEQAIERAVENGRISQEQADWLLEGLENGFVPLGLLRGHMHQRNPAPRAPAENNGGM